MEVLKPPYLQIDVCATYLLGLTVCVRGFRDSILMMKKRAASLPRLSRDLHNQGHHFILSLVLLREFMGVQNFHADDRSN